MDSKEKVRLLGLSPFGPGCGEHVCDPCLYNWTELMELTGSGKGADSDITCDHRPVCNASLPEIDTGSVESDKRQESDVEARTGVSAPSIRTVESEALRFLKHAVYGFPDDLLEAAMQGLGGSASSVDTASILARACVTQT